MTDNSYVILEPAALLAFATMVKHGGTIATSALITRRQARATGRMTMTQHRVRSISW